MYRKDLVSTQPGMIPEIMRYSNGIPRPLSEHFSLVGVGANQTLFVPTVA